MKKEQKNIQTEFLTDQEAEKLWHIPIITKNICIQEQRKRRGTVPGATAARMS